MTVDKVIAKIIWSYFFWPTLYMAYLLIKNADLLVTNLSG